MHRSAYLVVHDSAAAEDIAQESMIAAISALDRFDTSKPLAPWLNKIAVNNALKWLRSPARRENGAVAPELAHAPPSSSKEVSDPVMRALASLGAEHRAVVVLRYLLDCTPGEIAKALELPRGTVNSRLRRGLDQLGKLLGEEH